MHFLTVSLNDPFYLTRSKPFSLVAFTLRSRLNDVFEDGASSTSRPKVFLTRSSLFQPFPPLSADAKELDVGEHAMPSSQEEEEAIRRKYGGILPKKPPLISKDNERAYFDSADWALEKQGGKAEKVPDCSEPLPPKLQPTPQEQVRSRKSPYAPADTEGVSEVHES